MFKERGIIIGENTIILNSTFSNSSKGDLFYIGDNCTITGTTLLGHDASPTLFIKELQLHKHPILPGSRKSFRNPIYIGNNVFIGVGSIILPGIRIGNNSVVGAGSIVTKNVPDNSVVVGNPAKIVSSIDSFINKYKEEYIKYPERF